MPAVELKNLAEYTLNKTKIKNKCPKCQINLDLEYDFIPIKWRFVSLGMCPKCNNKIMNEVIIKKTFSGEEDYNEISTIINEIEYINCSYKFRKIINKLINH